MRSDTYRTTHAKAPNSNRTGAKYVCSPSRADLLKESRVISTLGSGRYALLALIWGLHRYFITKNASRHRRTRTLISGTGFRLCALFNGGWADSHSHTG